MPDEDVVARDETVDTATAAVAAFFGNPGRSESRRWRREWRARRKI
jgi:hypothetical protein